ncbi:MAG: YafY family transcriptional regulator, partial [Clostridia bacterium]|nr:YafY family transcriptional regulator [Clostridia bacterium]
MKYKVMIDILFTLLAKKKTTAEVLANKNGISKRSVYRYLDEMTVSGIPIDVVKGRGGGIYISDSYKLPVNYMTKKEYVAAIDAMKAMRGQIEDENLDSAIEKLVNQMKEEKQDLSVTGDLIVDSSTWGDYRFHEKIKLLQSATRELAELEIDYVARTGEHTRRKIDAHVLVYKQNVWYVYAYCHTREAFRLFKVGRIRTARRTGRSFERRTFLREEIPLQFWQETSKTVEIKLEISRTAVADVEEWLGVDCIQTADDKFFATMVLPDNDGLIQKILSLGLGVKVVAPLSLQKRLQKAARQIVEAYE